MTQSRTDDLVLEIVLEIVREVSGGDAVPGDDLFDLGFDSLKIAMTAARVRERLDVDLPLSTYFDAATVADVAAAVKG
jgi:acyl carrier protein